MFLDVDENEQSWFAEENLPVIDKNCYIYNSDKAVELISNLMSIPRSIKKYDIKNVRNKITALFSLYSDDRINNELEYFKRFMTLCDRLSERQKLKKIGDKTVIGVGGQFSAGKSKFINSVAGLNGLLPEATRPTTSIPTYIIGADSNSYTANSVYGKISSLTKEQLQALTHEFYDVYKIGFSSFVESIVISSENWDLDRNISLLDTPGYNKYDNKSINHITDKVKARDQLKIADFLIWLVDAENGTVTKSDIEFMEDLKIDSPILIVLNKCDKKTRDQIESVLDQAKSEVEHADLKCYGIVAYSALEQKEYGIRTTFGKAQNMKHLISDFFKFASESHARSNDIKGQFITLEDELKKEIEVYKKSFDETSGDLEKFIRNSENVMDIKSLSQVWSFARRKNYDLYVRSEEVNSIISEINSIIDDYLK